MAWASNLFINFFGGAADARIQRQTEVLATSVGADPDTDIFDADGTFRGAGVPGGMTAAVSALDQNSRLYLRGHGDWQQETIGGWSAMDVCELLKRAQLTNVGLVSVTACKGARAVDPGETRLSGARMTQAYQALLENSGYSFAGTLHKFLRGICRVHTDVHGRIYNLDIVEGEEGDESRKRGQERLIAGQKTVRREAGPDGRHVHHGSRTKIRFSWNGNTQMREWVSYS